MPRMTSAEVINLGEYLKPDFEPSSLTVPQLLGVLGYHNVLYPTPCTKPKLVQIFNDEIKAKAKKWKRERIRKENSIASDEGIIDGATGEPLRKESMQRRTSRRLSRALEDDESSPTSHSEPPKRRRSSAQPSLGRKKALPVHEVLVEESEPEDIALPPKKVGRKIKGGSKNRRVSNFAEDSGWEDNNIFQSGAESSSPARPSPVRQKATARRSTSSRRSKKSTSAPPQVPSPPRDSPMPALPRFSPPSTSFNPRISPSLPISGSNWVNLPVKQENGEGDAVHETIEEESQNYELTDVEAPALSISLKTSEEQDELTGRIIRDEIPSTVGSTGGILQILLRLTYILLVTLVCYCVLDFKSESASIGYCDPGSNTSHVLEQLKARRLELENCHEIVDTEGSSMLSCPLAPLIPWFRPEGCTLCPDHSKCTQFSVNCDVGYILQPHPLLFFLPPSSDTRQINFSSTVPTSSVVWKLTSTILDGLPGFGSIALPPRCVEDPKRKRHIGALGKAMESLLGKERGRRLCSGESGTPVVEGSEQDEAKIWGYEVSELKDLMRKKAPPRLHSTFDDTFDEAIQQLVQWGGIIVGEDAEHRRYVAHRTPDLTSYCIITVKLRQFWAEWRATLLALIFVLSGMIYIRAKAAQRWKDIRRVAELVQIALDTLRNQEIAYHTDPVSAEQPYLSSLQLRDLILQDQHSVSYRRKLWDQVERVVEGNANVRANLQETEGGDEMRVWRWVGSPGCKPE